MRKTRLTVTSILLAGALMAACGGGSEDDTATPAPGPASTAPPQGAAATAATTPPVQGSKAGDACGLVTASEAQAAVGAPLGAPTLSSPAPPQSGLSLELCTYPRVTGNALGVTVGVFTYQGGITSANFNDFARQSSNSFEPVSGVGDEALLSASAGTGQGRVLLRKGSKAADVSLGTDTNLREKLLDLSRKAASRL